MANPENLKSFTAPDTSGGTVAKTFRLTPDQVTWLNSQDNPSQTLRGLINAAMNPTVHREIEAPSPIPSIPLDEAIDMVDRLQGSKKGVAYALGKLVVALGVVPSLESFEKLKGWIRSQY